MIVNLSLQSLIQVLGSDILSCDADHAMVVHRISSLQTAGPNDLAIVVDRGDASVFDPVSDEAIKKSTAGVLLTAQVPATNSKCIVVKDPLAAFARFVAFIESIQEKELAAPVIAATALVDKSAVIAVGATVGDGAQIGAQVFVGKRCQIGNNVILYPGVKILDGCIIGDNTIIHAGAVIGSDGFGYQVTKIGLRKIPQVGIVRIGSHVEIGANCTIDRAAFDETVVGDGVKLDNMVHIAHNVIIGPHTVIIAQTGIAGSVRIGMGCQIGGQVAIKDHITIGNFVKIVSKSAVINNLKDNEIVCGIPAIPFGQWKRVMVIFNKLPEFLKARSARVHTAGATKSWWGRLFG